MLAELLNSQTGGKDGAVALAELEVDHWICCSNNSAIGRVGITYRDIRVAAADAQLLTAFYNACFRLEAVPTQSETSSTVLVYKEGDRDTLENWRFLVLRDTISNTIFAAVPADRLTD